MIAKSALSDLQEIKHYYAEQNVPHIGVRYVTKVLELMEVLQTHPKRGRIVPEFNKETIREIIHPPFRIVYLCETSRVTLIRVWRSERKMLLSLPRYLRLSFESTVADVIR